MIESLGYRLYLYKLMYPWRYYGAWALGWALIVAWWLA
jgi:hypothetical protein